MSLSLQLSSFDTERLKPALLQDKKRLEDVISELRLHTPVQTSAPVPGAGTYNASQQAAPLSSESKAVIQELESPRAMQELRSELSDVRNEMQRLTEEVGPSFNSSRI